MRYLRLANGIWVTARWIVDDLTISIAGRPDVVVLSLQEPLPFDLTEDASGTGALWIVTWDEVTSTITRYRSADTGRTWSLA
jgi:hypothetical protein